MLCAPDNVHLAAQAHPAKSWEESILCDMYRFVPQKRPKSTWGVFCFVPGSRHSLLRNKLCAQCSRAFYHATHLSLSECIMPMRMKKFEMFFFLQ
jgi:hypothetical protein